VRPKQANISWKSFLFNLSFEKNEFRKMFGSGTMYEKCGCACIESPEFSPSEISGESAPIVSHFLLNTNPSVESRILCAREPVLCVDQNTIRAPAARAAFKNSVRLRASIYGRGLQPAHLAGVVFRQGSKLSMTTFGRALFIAPSTAWASSALARSPSAPSSLRSGDQFGTRHSKNVMTRRYQSRNECGQQRRWHRQTSTFIISSPISLD